MQPLPRITPDMLIMARIAASSAMMNNPNIRFCQYFTPPMGSPVTRIPPWVRWVVNRVTVQPRGMLTNPGRLPLQSVSDPSGYPLRQTVQEFVSAATRIQPGAIGQTALMSRRKSPVTTATNPISSRIRCWITSFRPNSVSVATRYKRRS